MNNHTATPWLYEPAHKGFVITAKEGQYDIAVVRDIGNDDNEANAAHIVKCVNCHDDLLEALKLIKLTTDDLDIFEIADIAIKRADNNKQEQK